MSESEEFDFGDRIRLETLSDIPYSAIKDCSPEEIDAAILSAIVSQGNKNLPDIKVVESLPSYALTEHGFKFNIDDEEDKDVTFEDIKKIYGWD